MLEEGKREIKEWTRSTIEVAHFRYFVSERRGSVTPNRRNVNLDFEKIRFVDLGHDMFSLRCILVFAEVSLRVRCGAP